MAISPPCSTSTPHFSTSPCSTFCSYWEEREEIIKKQWFHFDRWVIFWQKICGQVLLFLPVWVGWKTQGRTESLQSQRVRNKRCLEVLEWVDCLPVVGTWLLLILTTVITIIIQVLIQHFLSSDCFWWTLSGNASQKMWLCGSLLQEAGLDLGNLTQRIQMELPGGWDRIPRQHDSARHLLLAQW